MAVTASAQQRGYGDRFDSLPNFTERQLHVLTNACRMAPAQYRDAYIGNFQVLLPANYPPVHPCYWNLALNRSSHTQAVDMANNCGLQHASCDGTAWNSRIQSYYNNKSSSIGENIATGNSTALTTVKQWVLEVDTSRFPVPPDKDPGGADGHRRNIMNGIYRELGCGYARGSVQWYYFWVQDFGGGRPDFTNPVVGGFHFFIVAGSITFFANYWDSLGAPDEIAVVIDSQTFPMTLAMGSAARGTYSLVQTRGTACRRYYFTCTRGSTTWRYPEYGVLVTSGEGSCSRDYIPPESLAAVIPVPAIPSSAPLLRFSLRDARHLVVSGMRDGTLLSAVSLADLQGEKTCFWNISGLQRRTADLVLPIAKHLSKGVYVGSALFENGYRRSQKLVLDH